MRVTRKLSGSSEFDFFFGIVVLFGGFCALGCASSNNDLAEWEALKARVEKLEAKLQEIEEKLEREKMQQIRARERADFSPDLSANDFRSSDIDHRPDTSNLWMSRNSEMTPEIREQQRLERWERHKKNLRRRIDSLSKRIEKAKEDGSRSEQQIERMERSLERMHERLQIFETDDYGAQH